MLTRLTNAFFPTRFQGAGRGRDYFEGYYVKVVDPVRGLALAFIPGVSYDAEGRGHAFVQVLDGVAATARYHRFELGDFAFAKTGFDLRVGGCRFRESGCDIDLPDVKGALAFRQNEPWPRRWYSPGAMGPFSFVPGMECKHAVVSLHHRVTGALTLPGGAAAELSERAVGYIEKDWGRSFPLRWVWLQTNHLAGEDQPCCLLVSSGRVPWATGAFDGFIAALWWRGRFLPFTTYNGARMRQRLDGQAVDLAFERGALRLEIDARPGPGVDLAAPVGAAGMVGRVNESLLATAEVRLLERGTSLLATRAEWMGLEVGGDHES